MVDINTNPLIGSKLGTLPQPTQPPVVGQFRGVKQAQAEASQESDRVGSAQIEYQTATNALRRAQQGLSQAQAEQNALKTDLQSAQGELQSANQQLQQAQVQAQQFQTQLASARQEMQAKITQGETDYQQTLRDLEAKRTASLAQVQAQQPSRTVIGQMTEAQVNALQPTDYTTERRALDDKYMWAEQLLKDSTYSSPEKSEGGVVTSKPIPGREADYERAKQAIFAKERELRTLNTKPQQPAQQSEAQIAREKQNKLQKENSISYGGTTGYDVMTAIATSLGGNKINQPLGTKGQTMWFEGNRANEAMSNYLANGGPWQSNWDPYMSVFSPAVQNLIEKAKANQPTPQAR